MSDIRNAKIADTYLGIEDHGMLTFFITLDYGGVIQGFGGWRLDSLGLESKLNLGNLIRDILNNLEVGSWEDLKGKPVRAKIENGSISEIGHFLNDDWVNPKNYYIE